ncbi:hypothetical protein [Terrimonas pollutisoli]|uniref:hypothetical protein n=1 Tax=Terrimonas pollutisoli TaxID=3034147 RepID=UPI0023EB3037|nr:hypothetical protein [Terrimonas sp. H1YJ31]
MEVAQITYRLFDKKDLPGILSLWENFSGWGGISKKQFNDWYLNIPGGPSLIIVATNGEDEVIGQLVFVPAKVFLCGNKVKALRLSAPILHKDFRQTDLRNNEHPAFMMIKTGCEIAQKQGYSLLYGLPAHGWIGLLKLFPRFGLPDVEMTTWGCSSISLKNEMIWEQSNKENFSTSIGTSFDESYNKLWETAVSNFPVQCGVVRNAPRLQWKISRHLVIEVKKENELLGYAAYKKADGLLVDILAGNVKDLKKVLLASIKALHHKNENRYAFPLEEIKLMRSPHIVPLLKEIDHSNIDFQFAFGCYPLQAAIAKDAILPERWYIMPDD